MICECSVKGINSKQHMHHMQGTCVTFIIHDVNALMFFHTGFGTAPVLMSTCHPQDFLQVCGPWDHGYYYYYRFMAPGLCPGPGWAGTGNVPIWIYWSKR